MSKWIDNFNMQNKIKVRSRIEKLQAEYKEYENNYRDFPYDRYLKAMERREKEIEELETYADPDSAKREVEDYREEIKRLREILGKIHYLSVNIDPSDKKSDGNIRKLQSMTANYESNDYTFKASAEAGVW